ncbi:MAG: hypothetical protein ACR2QO_28590 [Acidimicrobiales bacterium]
MTLAPPPCTLSGADLDQLGDVQQIVGAIGLEEVSADIVHQQIEHVVDERRGLAGHAVEANRFGAVEAHHRLVRRVR